MLVLYTLSIFLSAFLVFMVQPMVGRIFLPWVGGAPAAWNTCMFFFQLLLLGGYFYTHLSFKKLSLRRQMLLHMVLMGVAALALPIAFRGDGVVPDDPAFWLLQQLFLTAALPFLMISATAPMLQKWFSLSAHPRAASPFFLYAASNTGSLAALLVYPVLIEPVMNIQQQAELWSYGFGLLSVLLIVCASLVRPAGRSDSAAVACSPPALGAKPTTRQTLLWLAAAAVPSSLFLAATHYLTRDIAPVPFLWLLPLTIYLLTYILAFSEWFKVGSDLIKKAAGAGLLLFLPVYFLDGMFEIWLTLPVHLYVLFSFALLCHKYLADSRPAAEHLTWFYLWLSVGGVVGGFFNSVVAPTLFTNISEYPLVILLATIFISGGLQRAPGGETGRREFSIRSSVTAGVLSAALIWLIFEVPIHIWAFKLGVYFAVDCSTGYLQMIMKFITDQQVMIKFVACVAAAGAAYAVMQRNMRISLLLFVAVVMALLFVGRIGKKDPVIFQSRNFFGTKEVIVTNRGTLHQLVHGNTLHGAQSFAGGMRREPLAYYHRLGPMGDIFALPVAKKPQLRVAVLGLGPGNAAAWGKSGDRFTFFEIDPEIVLVATGISAFTYLAESAASCSVIIGDARLKMAQQPDNSFDMIIMAAFSSDSIPAHLVTMEAMRIYLQKLAPDGVIVANVSNRYLDLVSLLGVTAEACGLQSVGVSDHEFNSDARENFMRMPSLYVLMSRDAAQLPTSAAPFKHHWKKIAPGAGIRPWSDSFSSLMPLLRLEQGSANDRFVD